MSIGVPVRNGAPFLARALESLLAQRWAGIEVLVSDNASTDDSWKIAQAYAARDSRIRLSRSTSNLGMEANFARVLQLARGSYFMWAACDDWWAPDFVSTLVAALDRRPDAMVAMAAVERVDESGRVVDVVRFRESADPSRMSAWALTMQLAGGRPYHLFIYGLYRTSFLKRAFTGFAPVIASDRLFVCRVAMAAPFTYVDQVLHRRLIRQQPLAERYSRESVGRRWRGSVSRWRVVFAAGPYLWRSPVIPRKRLVWVPAVVLRLAKANLGHALAQTGLVHRRVRSSGTC